MNEKMRKIRKSLASIMVWVLLFNNIPMLDLIAHAEENKEVCKQNYAIEYPIDGLHTISDNDVCGGYVSGGDVSGGDVSGGDMENNGICYGFIKNEIGAALNGNVLDFSNSTTGEVIVGKYNKQGDLLTEITIQLNENKTALFQFRDENEPIQQVISTSDWTYDVSALLYKEGDSEVKYSIAENLGSVEIDEHTGTLIGHGEVSVNVIAERVDEKEHYGQKKDSIIIDFLFENPQDFCFEQNTYIIDYPKDGIYDIPKVKCDTEDGIIQYRLSDSNEVIQDGKIDFSNRKLPCEVKLLAIKKGVGDRDLCTTETVLKVDEYKLGFVKDGNIITEDHVEKQFERNMEYSFQAKCTTEGETIKYTIESESVENMVEFLPNGEDAEQKLLIKKPGKVTIKATVADNKMYNETIATLCLYVKSEQEELEIVNPPSVITYNEYEDNVVHLITEGGSVEGKVRFEVVHQEVDGQSCKDVVNLSEGTGELKILKAGDIVVKAINDGNDEYLMEESEEIKIHISKADQSILFESETPEPFIYGSKTIFVNKAKDNKNETYKGSANSEIQYSIRNGGSIAGIDENGILHFKDGQTGIVEVMAYKPGDERYNETSATYVLEVQCEETPEITYSLKKTKNDTSILNQEKWFNHDVYICAPEGYQISRSNVLHNNQWQDAILLTTENNQESRNEEVFYLKRIGGGITEQLRTIPIKIDRKSPEIGTILYSVNGELLTDGSKVAYSNTPVDVLLSASDSASGIETFTYYMGQRKEGDGITVGPDEMSTAWEYSFVMEPQFKGQVLLEVMDKAGNVAILTESDGGVVLDDIDPVLIPGKCSNYKKAVYVENLIEVEDYETSVIENSQRQKIGLYYTNEDDIEMIFRIKEKNFNVEDVVFQDTYYDTQPPVELDWIQESEDVYKLTYTINSEDAGVHVVKLYYQDRSDNNPIEYTSETIIIDAKQPVISMPHKVGEPAYSVVGGVAYYGDNHKAMICINEDNFRASDVDINIDITDASETVDVESIKAYLKNPDSWKKTADGYVAFVDFNINARYDIRITYKDLALREAENFVASIVVDKSKPVILPLHSETAYNTDICERMVDKNNNSVSVADATTRFIYKDAMTFRFTMKETNFHAADVVVSVYRDGEKLENGDGYLYEYNKNWSLDHSSHTHTLSLELGKCQDGVVEGDYQVEIAYTDRAGHAMTTYTSNVISIDQSKPIIQIDYDNNEVLNKSYYNEDRVATIKVTDRNVVSKEINVAVVAKDIDGNVVPFDLATKQSGWVFDKGTNTWTSEIRYDVDAKYHFTISCKDMATYGASDEESFTVDKTAPSKESFRFEYSTSLTEKTGINSNNAFYKDKVTIKIIAEDVTSPIDYFEWTYIKKPGASSINQEVETHIIHNSDTNFEYDANKRTATAEFALTADQAKQYCGNLRFKATDMAGNASEELIDTERIVIVDTISPTRTVTYSPASQIVNKDTLNTMTGFDYASENAGAVLLYDAPMTVTFKVYEANFYAEDIVVKVNNSQKSVANWSKSGDVWTGSLPITENGEYVIALQYTDRSTNKMVDYVSHKIIIDTIKPQIHVNYSSNDIKQAVDGVKYYDKQQTATITITERNFRAEDIDVIVKATDINGNNIAITDYNGYLQRRSSWSKQGDTYTANITFSTDANYDFDIAYQDLALNSSDDYPNDMFTVDQTAPINVSVKYSSPVLEKTSLGITYEFYNEPIVVTITAEDDVSGVHGFDYSYTRADGVSLVNLDSVTNKMDASKITYSNGKKTATATFVIPASELHSGTQLNGNMEYVVYNRSLMTTDYKDPKRYIVDNASPNLSVEFSECINSANNTSYYAGDITATITIDEANFYAEDVAVSISKDGGEQIPVNVFWRTVSVDEHIGTFTLEEEGDYQVYISYQDPATNKVTDYQSNQLTIDKTKPVVSVSGIRYNSANKKEVIGYVVTVEDKNLDTKSFCPKLMAEIRNESGAIEQIDFTEFGTIETVVTGKSCTYTITNIEQDGIFHFNCIASDMSGNTTEEMSIKDSGNKIVSALDYSVNRNGSTYSLDENTKRLNNCFVKNSIDIVVYEINPDEISNIRITLFKNDKSIVLVEGKDYVVNMISEDGEWYKYEYTIFAKNFEEDGTYRISIYSEDKAGNIAENNLDVKNVEINFGIDKTLPNLIVTNLENGVTYPLDKLSVLMQATDNMKLVNITVELDGVLIASWDEEQIQQMGNNLQDFVFDVMGDSTQAHTLTITLTDIAGNQTVETISDFHVTTNLWIRFTSNKLLFYGSIGACLFAGFSIIPLWKRRKKRKEAKG